MTIDTLAFTEALENAKVPQAQARAHAKAMKDHVLPQLATKHDLTTLLIQMTGINLAIASLSVAIIVMFISYN